MNSLLTLPERLAPLLGTTTFHAVSIQGRSREEGLPISAVYLGSGRNNAWLRNYFLAHAEVTDEELLHLPRIAKRALKSAWESAELRLTDLPPLWAALTPRSELLRVPAWIRQELRLPHLPSTPGWPLPVSTAREVERHIRRHGYALTITREIKEIEDFYQGLYLPYIRQRHGSDAVLVERSRFLRESRGHTLAQLRSQGRTVAGMMLFRAGRRMRLGWFGALTGERAPKGLSETLDALVIRFAWMDGITCIDFGKSRPCLADGVFRYKARFGAVPMPARFPQAVLGISLPRSHPALLNSLRNRPLLGMSKGGLAVYRVPGSAGAGVWSRWDNDASAS